MYQNAGEKATKKCKQVHKICKQIAPQKVHKNCITQFAAPIVHQEVFSKNCAEQNMKHKMSITKCELKVGITKIIAQTIEPKFDTFL